MYYIQRLKIFWKISYIRKKFTPKYRIHITRADTGIGNNENACRHERLYFNVSIFNYLTTDESTQNRQKDDSIRKIHIVYFVIHK